MINLDTFVVHLNENLLITIVSKIKKIQKIRIMELLKIILKRINL